MGGEGRRGRRQGPSGTREAIEASARRQFAELGYDRTSLRQVAIEAGVDPTLVTHYFGSKPRLFAAVAQMPFVPKDVIPTVIAGDRARVGERLARFTLGVMESPEGRGRVISVVRAATAEPEAARMIRDRIVHELLATIAEEIGSERAAYRGSLLMSQIVGMTMARYIVKVEPLASMPAEAVAADIAPTLQRYLTGELAEDTGPAAPQAPPG